MEISVTDNGVAITDDEAKQLFKPYKTLAHARNTHTAGPGLGLYMCKRLALEMKGKIWIKNNLRPSQGTKSFIVSLRATRPS